eukprot:CAMPEP_0170505916 /NCGR_PEP_ID=MMETSP0208-20121228/52786_1 /TAXON_ID=197538 /ORGANISM="Strombidium inclinatum, Strain S3" /LENGTH=79 /DNA_ID=CAMNT_0010787095 /DNA_START=20 /DNA_END=255 /DNA_ORIENTATION=+
MDTSAILKHTGAIEDLKQDLQGYQTLKHFEVQDTTLTDEIVNGQGVFTSFLQMERSTSVESLGGLSMIFEDFLGLKAKS